MVFIFGIKRGFTETDKKANKFLRLLKYLGKNKKFHPDLNLTVISTGIINGKRVRRKTSFYCTEVQATALAPVIFCRHLIEGKYDKKGAFYPTDITDVDDFVNKLAESGVHYQDVSVEI